MTIYNCNEPVAKTIIQIIESKGLKQCVVADKAGFTTQAFNAMLNGRKLIRPNAIPAIAQALGVTPNELFGINSKKGAKKYEN